jgi:MFS family permease
MKENKRRITAVLIRAAIGSALAWDFWSLVCFRFIGGLGIGGASVFGPVFVAELSPARLRGRMVILFQYNVCLGILVAFFSNALIGTLGFDTLHVEWRVMLGMGALPALLFFAMLFTIPESPRWLVTVNCKLRTSLAISRTEK